MQTNLNSNKVMAFAGFFGSSSGQNLNVLDEYKIIFDKPKSKLIVDAPEHEDPNRWYVHDNDTFVWTGGSKKLANSEIASFDYNNTDQKFVFITCFNDQLHIRSDHYSKIPLFYSVVNNTIYFASSLKLLINILPEKELAINYEAMLFYYNFGFTSYDPFIVKNITVLPAGKHLTFTDGTLKIDTYFSIINKSKSSQANVGLQANIQSIDKFLFQGTKEAIKDHNSLGIALSGGVDSGYLAQKIHETGRLFNAYTLGFANDYNEFERIDYLSKKLDFKATKIVIDPAQIIANYLEVSSYSSFPVGFNNSILNFIYKQAKDDGVTIMFDGDGADRLFLGMNKYLQLQKILSLYNTSKKLGLHKLAEKTLALTSNSKLNKLAFYFAKFNNGFPFYGERKLGNNSNFNIDFEERLNNLALTKDLKDIETTNDPWRFFTLFSIYYTPAFFFHTPYELQLKHGLTSNPQFWTDDIVNLAMRIPTSLKLKGKTTKFVLREAAKQKIDDGYWNLKKIGLQNSFNYMKSSKIGQEFISDHLSDIEVSNEAQYLKEVMPNQSFEKERLLTYFIWKKQFLSM